MTSGYLWDRKSISYLPVALTCQVRPENVQNRFKPININKRPECVGQIGLMCLFSFFVAAAIKVTDLKQYSYNNPNKN